MCLLAYDKEGNIIHIDDALPRTDYICSDCGNILRVKKGEIKAKHFFHLNTENCGGTGESLIHKYFKKKILKFKTIKIPIYYLEPNTRIHLYDEDTGLDGDYIASKITLPLAYNGTMTITATKAAENLY